MRRLETLSAKDQAWVIFATAFLAYQDAVAGLIPDTELDKIIAAVSYGQNMETLTTDYDSVFPVSGPPKPPGK